MIASYAQNRGWDLGATSVEVDYDPDSIPRRFTIDIHLPTTSHPISGAGSSASPRPVPYVAQWKPDSPSRSG